MIADYFAKALPVRGERKAQRPLLSHHHMLQIVHRVCWQSVTGLKYATSPTQSHEIVGNTLFLAEIIPCAGNVILNS